MTHMFTGLKVATLTGALGLFALESSVDQPDLVKYAITQGGLTVALLICIWWIRQDNARQRAEDAKRLSDKDDRIGYLIDMQKESTASQVKTADGLGAQARAIESLTAVLNSVNLRTGERPHP